MTMGECETSTIIQRKWPWPRTHIQTRAKGEDGRRGADKNGMIGLHKMIVKRKEIWSVYCELDGPLLSRWLDFVGETTRMILLLRFFNYNFHYFWLLSSMKFCNNFGMVVWLDFLDVVLCILIEEPTSACGESQKRLCELIQGRPPRG